MYRLLSLVGLAALLLAGLSAGPSPRAAAASATTHAGACRWLMSPGGVGTYRTIFADLDQAPLDELRFGEPYSPVRLQIARDGFLDFNADQRADVFRVRPRPDGLWQWQYLPGGGRSWLDLNYASPPLDDLRFGDFDGDGKTDIFTSIAAAGGYQWLVSSGGTAGFQLLRTDPLGVAELRFGDFDGDGRTDIFSVEPRQDGLWQWRYAAGGSQTWANLNYASPPLGDLRFGDFDGNGKTDIFATIAAPGGYQWLVSSGGTASFQLLRTDPLGAGDLRLGDIDSDGKTDIFSVAQRQDGLWQWRYASAGSGPWLSLNYAASPLGELRLGLFDSGLSLDVLALSCAQYPATPLPPASASLVLGQADLTRGERNRGAAVAADSLAGPAATLVAPDGKLFVADYLNSRVLLWRSVAGLSDGQPADLVLGQPDLTTPPVAAPYTSCAPASAATLCGPEALAYDPRGEGTLYVADTHHHRVLAYRGPFTQANQAAARVYGQSDNMAGGRPNHGGGTALDEGALTFPRGLAFDPVDHRLFVADDFNHRVLIFRVDDGDTLADLVLGYPNLTDTLPKECSPIGATSLCSPKGLAYDPISDTLYVADYDQARVLQYRGPFAQNNYPASLAFGQPAGVGNLTSAEQSCRYNDGETLTGIKNSVIAADRLCNPLDLALAPDGTLLVSDATNSRVLAFANPLGDDQAVALTPDAVYGQGGSFTSGEKNRPDPPAAPTGETLYRPMGLAFFQGALYLSDADNNRVLRFSIGHQAYLPLVVRP